MKTKSNGNRKKLFGKSGYKAFFAPWCGVILIALLTSSPLFGSMGRPYRSISLPEVKNYQFVEKRGEFPTIVIDQQGKAWLDGYELDDGPKAVMMIEDLMEELKCYKKKVFLKADESVQFGRIAEVLEILSKAGIKVVAFITDEYAAPIDFFKDFKKNRALIIH
jgi:biopolymer transport protein ExbD